MNAHHHHHPADIMDITTLYYMTPSYLDALHPLPIFVSNEASPFKDGKK